LQRILARRRLRRKAFSHQAERTILGEAIGFGKSAAHRSKRQRPGPQRYRGEVPSVVGVGRGTPAVRRLCSTLAAAAIVAGCGGSTSTAPTALLLRQAAHADDHVAPQILENFAFFAPHARLGRFGHGANAFTVSQRPFSSLRSFVLRLAAEGAPCDPRAAREVSTPSGLRVWIIPGNGICIFDPPNGTGECSTNLELALRQGVLKTQTVANGTYSYIGVVPNTNVTVTAKTVSGRTRTMPVIDGLFITPAAGLGRFLSFRIEPAS
jgi:hypothetical protein